MVTASSLFHFLNFLNITIDIRNVCVFLAPLFSSLTVIVVYFLTKLVLSYCHCCLLLDQVSPLLLSLLSTS